MLEFIILLIPLSLNHFGLNASHGWWEICIWSAKVTKSCCPRTCWSLNSHHLQITLGS